MTRLTILQALHQGGGAGSVISTLHLSLGLARAGMAIRLVCPPNSEVETLAREGGLDVHPVQLLPRQRRANAAALAQVLDRYPVDLINSQSSRDRGALTWLALRGRLRVPLVVTRRQMPRTMIFENWLVSRAAARVVAVSRSVADALVRRGTPPSKITVIPNGLVAERIDIPVAPSAVEAWKQWIGWEPSRRTIGVVARPKDQEVLLRALPAVRTPVRLVLAGVDPESRLARLTRDVGDPHRVVCLPFRSDIRPLYELLEVVLLPSRSEGLSQGLLEAMALGKPVLASAAPGNIDLITDRVDGLLLPPREPTAWAQAIEELLGNSALAVQLGTAAKHTARVTFALSRTVDRTIRLYESLVPGSSVLRTDHSGAASW